MTYVRHATWRYGQRGCFGVVVYLLPLVPALPVGWEMTAIVSQDRERVELSSSSFPPSVLRAYPICNYCATICTTVEIVVLYWGFEIIKNASSGLIYSCIHPCRCFISDPFSIVLIHKNALLWTCLPLFIRPRVLHQKRCCRCSSLHKILYQECCCRNSRELLLVHSCEYSARMVTVPFECLGSDVFKDSRRAGTQSISFRLHLV